jgi:hypothetical protein
MPEQSKPKPDNKADSAPAPLRPDEQHKEPLQIQILEKMSQLMTAAFGFIAAFSWNEAMKALITEIWGEKPALWVRFGYAVIVTIAAVIAGLWIANSTHKVKAALGHGHPPMTA